MTQRACSTCEEHVHCGSSCLPKDKEYDQAFLLTIVEGDGGLVHVDEQGLFPTKVVSAALRPLQVAGNLGRGLGAQ